MLRPSCKRPATTSPLRSRSAMLRTSVVRSIDRRAANSAVVSSRALPDCHKHRKLTGRHADLPGQPVIMPADSPGGLAGVVKNAERKIVLFHAFLCAYTHSLSRQSTMLSGSASVCHQHIAFICEGVTVSGKHSQPVREEVKMTDAVQAMEDMKKKIQENWGWFLALGIALVIGGVILIAAPLATSIAVTNSNRRRSSSSAGWFRSTILSRHRALRASSGT